MSKVSKIKELLQKIVYTFNQVVTDKGILRYDGDELEIGVGVVLVDEEGNESIAEDGNYYLGEEDGRTLVVESNTVKDIILPDDNVEDNPDEFSKVCAEKFESYEERERKIYEAVKNQKGIEGWLREAGDDYAVICIWKGDVEKNYRYPYTVAEDGEIVVGDGEEVVEAFVPAEDEVVVSEEVKTEESFEDVENPTNEGEESDTEAVVQIRKEVNELYEIVRKLEERIEALEKKPAQESAEEEFRSKNSFKKTGIQKVDRLVEIMNR